MINESLSPASFITLKAYTNSIKQGTLFWQGLGDVNEGQTNNFVLYNTSSLCKGKANKERVTYKIFFK